jgi:hypothetical protein
MGCDCIARNAFRIFSRSPLPSMLPAPDTRIESDMTTKFEARHVLPFPPEAFWRLVHGNSEFNDALYNTHLKHRYEVLENDPVTGKWLSKMYPNVVLPAVLAKAAAGKEEGFCLAEDGVLDRTNWIYKFKVIPSIMSDNVDVRGEMVILPHGDGHCQRVVKFEIDVRAFGIGKIVEAFVEKTVLRGYDDSGEFLQRYMAGRA